MPHLIGDPDELITAIQHVARSEAAEKQKEAQRQADAIQEDAHSEADRVRQEILDQAHARAAQNRRQHTAEATRRARREYLTAREELLEQVWQEAEDQLRALMEGADEYADALRRLAQLGARMLGPGDLTLAADPQGHDLLTDERLDEWNAQASRHFDATVTFARAADPAETWGGLVISQPESRRRVDATFPTRLALARDELRDELFGQLVQQA